MSLPYFQTMRFSKWHYAVFTGLLFYCTGRLMFPLTWSGSYAGAIWPPAGIGLGAVLLWGNAVLPGIYLADLLLHIEVFPKLDTTAKKLIFTLAPLASVLRSWLGGMLVKRFADYPNDLVSIRLIVLFFLLSGPFATFVPAIISTSALFLRGAVPEEDFTLTFLSWWLGDCSGIAVFTPIFFIIFSRSHRIWKQRLLTLGLPLLVIFLVVATGYLFAQSRETGRLHKLISDQTKAIKETLQTDFKAQKMLLRRYITIQESHALQRSYFDINARADLLYNPELLKIEWLHVVQENKGYRFIREYQATRNKHLDFEFDSIKDLIGKFNLPQSSSVSIKKNNQFLVAIPKYDSGVNSCHCVVDVVVGVFDLEKFMSNAIAKTSNRHIVVRLLDDPAHPKTISPTGLTSGQMSQDPLSLSKLETINVGDQSWFFQVIPGPKFLNEYYSWSPWQLLVAGMFFTGCLSIGLLVLTGHTEFVSTLVDKRTLELRNSNLKLAAREKQFRKLVQTQSAIVWRADPITFRFVFVSAESVSILGYPIKQWLQEPDFWQKHMHEDDRERVLTICNRAIASLNSNSVEIEYRMIASDGHIVWLRDVITLVIDNGIISELYGFMIDITRQKYAEEQLRLAANTFEAQQGIMITDHNAKILRVNKAFTQITGFTPQQVVGQNPRILKSGRHDQAFFQDYWQQLLTVGKFEGEIWNRRKNGEIYPEWQTVTAVKNDRNEISHFVSVFSDITEKKDAENKIHNMAFYDPLTNLPNRRLLLDRFDQEIAIARRHKQYGAVLYLDLDHFKVLNDSQGHLVGDELLIQVAHRLSSALREEDTPARLGGDEFVVLLHANSPTLSAAADRASVVAEKVREQLYTPFVLNNYQHQIGTSIGIALFPEDHETPDVILQQADTAMYRSKSSGRNTISFFQPSMQEAADLRLSLEQDLRGAIDQGRFILCYHPQMDVNGQMDGVEALIRWEDKQKGRLSPADFIPVAEESNLIIAIGKWVMMEACNQIKMWQEDGFKNVPAISINVSSRQFRQPDFVGQIQHAIETTGIEPGKLGIELTESVMIADSSDTIAKMKALKALGVTIAVDDFGTGYSSLVYLKQLPIDILKIDQGFIRDILNDSNDAIIVETIISMASHLKIKVIAEGVETIEQLNFLKEKGCTIFQGYFYDRPLTAANFAEQYLKKIAVKI